MSEMLVSHGLNVPLRGAAAGSPAALANTRVQEVMASHNKRGRRPLTTYEAAQLADGEINMVYIYNVSPIHRWMRPQGQLGTVIIPPRTWKESVSAPFPIKGAIVRWYKTGLGLDQPHIEGGMEIAMDVCGITPGVESHPTDQLPNYGVFLSTRPFEAEHLPDILRHRLAKAKGPTAEQLHQEYVVPKHEQKEMIQEANQKLVGVLQGRILEADNWHQGGVEARKFIGDWHRQCLKAFNHITGKKESRPWASINMDENLEGCLYCGTMNKGGLVVCPNCHNVLDQTRFDELKAEIATRPAKKG